MTPRPAKFMFATEFGSPEPRRKIEESEREIARLVAEVAAAEGRGFQAGVAKGKQDGEVRELARIAAALERLAAAAGETLARLGDERAAIEGEAIELALATGRTLARHLIAREPEGELLALLGEALSNLRGAPHLVLRVAPDLVETVEAKVKRLAWEKGYEGRLIVLGDPDAGAGDCRIEWADGGIVRDRAAMDQEIDRIVRRHIEPRPAGETE